ncbi:zinc-binding dehydrogenase [Actinomadura sp. LOL_016]|uniref:zinc-binding dehydrogenase n=1 Tax=unclassified Actinomadura TaxID=2626254 RepID=UPI003A7FDF91
MHAVAVDPDALVRSGAYRTPMPVPFVIGRDLVGEVAEEGTGTGFAAGQPVWGNSLGHHGRQGSFAEYAASPADRLYAAPDDVGPHVLVAAAHPAATAWLALFRHARLRYSDRAHVGGGARNVGSAAVALASAAGAEVTATSRPDDFDRVRAWGAAEVVDYRPDDLADRLRGPLDVHLDTSGHGDPASALRLPAPGGRLVVMAGVDREASLPLGALYTRDASIAGFAISNATVAGLRAAADAVVRLLRTTSWRPRIAARPPLSRAADAHRRPDHHEGQRPPIREERHEPRAVRCEGAAHIRPDGLRLVLSPVTGHRVDSVCRAHPPDLMWKMMGDATMSV